MAAIQRALISVSDKSGVVDFAKELNGLGVEISGLGRILHLIEATDGELDPWTVTNQFDSLEDIIAKLRACSNRIS